MLRASDFTHREIRVKIHVDCFRHEQALRMERSLLERLAKLHTNARSCCRDLRRARAALVGTDEFEASVELLSALADSERLAMVGLLQQYEELCACEIESAFDLSHATMAHHLNRLSQAGVIESRKSGKWCYYRLARALPDRWRAPTALVSGRRRKSRGCCCS